jgi:hypothetical protein
MPFVLASWASSWMRVISTRTVPPAGTFPRCVGFTCRLGDTVIEGIVKPKEKAKEIYQEAKSKGVLASWASSWMRVISTRTVPPAGTFPRCVLKTSAALYESSSIVGFTCRLGDTVIEGIVKPKEKAKEIYQG